GNALRWLGLCHGLVPIEVAPGGDTSWRMVSLDSPEALVEDGEAMHHCAGAYRALAEARSVSLWSLQRSVAGGRPSRVATVEVALGVRAVVQARGFANAPCASEALDVVERWAAENHLSVRLRGA
ncbi:MAG TPA: PcfJ domain-containing protein, partial [Myxococcota bacterium]|nr:PcfJ domain-containing protein [Myxococcota bacterium]